MEINLRNNFGGDISVEHATHDLGIADAKQAADGASGAIRPAPNLSVDVLSSDPILGSEPIADIPEDALSRDDDLGRLVASAFALPAPPMPDFGGV